jgi:hypothetical protein
MKQFWLILAIFLGLASTAVPASADIQWTLNQGGSLGPNGVTYGTVTAKQVGTGTSAYVEVTITLAPNNYFLATGSHTGIDWNMSVVPGALNIVSSTNPHSDPTKFTKLALNGNYADAPFSSGQNGAFHYAIKPTATGGGAATENSIVFDLTKVGGLALTTGLFTPNAGGYYWAIDIGLNCTIPAGKTEKKCNGGTGVVAANSYVQVPEPGTWTMSIAGLTGLMGLMLLQRRRKTVRA